MTTLFALLVGLNEYDPNSRVRALRGCLNDTLKVETFLLENLGVPRENVKVLRNEEATRDGILATFRSYLIENPKIEKDAQILFHYSGHGSRVRDFQGVEPDGYHESLVAYDSRTVGKTDVLDKELGTLLEDLAAAKGSNITVILDSCHSGSGTRDLPEDEGIPLNREIEPDERPLPAEVADFVRRYAGGSRGLAPTQSVSGWTPSDMPYVLLSGCRDEELSREYEGTPGVWNGAMTYFTTEYLKRLPANATYRDLHETVAAQVNAVYKEQNPQCEGDRNRVIFGGARVERYPFINVVGVEGDTITLDGGIVHDLREGTQLKLYAPEIRTLADAKNTSPLVTVEVTRADVTTSDAKIVPTPGEVRIQNASDVPTHARGVVTAQAFDLRRQKVALLHDGDPASIAATTLLEATIKGDGDLIKPSIYLEVVKEDAAPAYYVKAKASNYEVYDGNGKLLLTPVDFAKKREQPSDEIGASRIREGLEGIARWQVVHALKNEVSAELEKQVTLRMRRVKPGSNRTEAEEPITPNNDGSVSLFYDAADKEQNKYALEIQNGSGQTLFANVFLMTHDYGIYQMYPRQGQGDAITGTLTIGLKQSAAPSVTIFLEDDEISTTEFLKVILTTDGTNLSMLTQEALEVPPTQINRQGSILAQIIDASVNGGERGAGLLDEDDNSGIKPWAGLTLPFHVVRKSDSTELPLEEGRVDLTGDAQGMWVEKPAGFTGKVTVTTVGQEVRALSDLPTTPQPPALAKSPDQFQLLERTGVRDTAAAGMVIEIETDERAHQIISDKNPLRLNVGNLNDKNVEVVPVYYDGEDFVLAGYDEGETLNLITLPPPGGDGMDEVTARGVGRTVKLFLYKKIGRKIDDIGLRHFTISDKGVVKYDAVDPTLFKAGDKVAVFVHGFSSDSEAMVRDPVRQLAEIGMVYDHYLAFDYESFGTSINHNGETLATALKQQARFKAGDGITVHVYAHSMGGVVTRCMVDLHGGSEFVDAVVIAGSPANGTPLANTVEGGIYLLSSMLNQANIPFVGNVAGFLGAFREQGPGLKDLEVDSPLARQLNALQNPSNVPYLLMAGENNPIVENRAKRLANKVKDGFLDAFFGEQNDSVIGVSSVHAVRLGHYPEGSEKVTLPCDHFHYFAIPETAPFLKAWLADKSEQ